MMEQEYAYCSGQCQASRFPPVSCRCICGGRNHGILRVGRGVINVTPKTHDQRFNEWMEKTGPVPQIAPVPALPYLQNRGPDNATSSTRGPTIHSPRETDLLPVGRTLKRFVKKITGIRSADDLNMAVRDGLRHQFNREKVEAIIDEAFTEFYSRQPEANRPELYELYESGLVDKALDRRNVRWVIGRPKRISRHA